MPVAPRPWSDLASIAIFSVALSYFVKYGETLLPFAADQEAAVTGAAGMVFVLSAINVAKWAQRSGEDGDFEGWY